MRTMSEIIDPDGAVERRYYLDGAEVDQAAFDAPEPPDLAERIASVERRLDKAATASVTGEAAKLRDNLKPAT